ncbi:type II secretion system F family protein [Psychromonas hadalis]|uniref:type II secretion system F family protein n=1 Tax=Psychromonas hadalis TaxID=211669 RepID=UPI0003B464CA|nr:type II secretion system F family protein [Psychromonas hadalis]
MEYILSLINTFIKNPQNAQWVFYIVAGVAGVTLAMSLSLFFSGVYSPLKKQLNKVTKGTSPDASSTFNKSLEHTLTNLPFAKRQFMSDKKTRRLLIHAGFHNENSLKIYNALKLLLLLLATVLGSITIKYLPELSPILSAYIFVMIVGFAYLLPGLALTYIANARMKALRKFFPDALDLLVVCCESGLGLLEAFQRVANELAYAHPPLSHELGLVCSKVRAGYSMQDALHEFSERTGLEDIRGLNSVIVQSLKLGTGIADTLRLYADEYREKRLQEAEEMAAKLGVKMVFPMMFCIWPSFFIVAIGPAVLKVMAVWDQAF